MNMDPVCSQLLANLPRDIPAPRGLEPLPDKGLAHWHVRLIGTGWLARIPKQSQMDLAALENLRYQSACFQRAAPSGHVPLLHSVIEPSAGMPRGALLVEEIVGTPASEPHHLAPIMQALAAIHALPVPVPEEREPLLNERNPLAGLVALIDAQARHLDHAAVPPASARAVKARLGGVVFMAWGAAAERVLVGQYDCEFGQRVSIDPHQSHPGYFNLRLGKQSWVMKPVLSQTGAIRLEDVRGTALLIQILTKSMLLDPRKGQRLVDGCMHEVQRAAERDLASRPRQSMLGGN